MKGAGIILSTVLIIGSIGSINDKEEEIDILTNEKTTLIEQIETLTNEIDNLNSEKKGLVNSKEWAEDENERLKETISKLKEEKKQLKKDKQTETEKLTNRIVEINDELVRVENENVLLKAEVRNLTEQADTSDNSPIVYANGGSSSSNKYHKSSGAHGMKGAIKMTRQEAREKGYVACKSCY